MLRAHQPVSLAEIAGLQFKEPLSREWDIHLTTIVHSMLSTRMYTRAGIAHSFVCTTTGVHTYTQLPIHKKLLKLKGLRRLQQYLTIITTMEGGLGRRWLQPTVQDWPGIQSKTVTEKELKKEATETNFSNMLTHLKRRLQCVISKMC